MIRVISPSWAVALSVLIALSALCSVPAWAQAPSTVSWPDLSTAKAIGGGEKDAAVVVAIEKYAEVPVVTGAKANGRAWYEWLLEGRKVPLEHSKLLGDRKATKERIEAAVAKAAAQVSEGGTLWVVYIGHGATTKDEKDGIWVGADAQQDADSLYARSLRQRDVVAVLERSKASRIVVVVDACFSGRTAANQPLVPNLQPLRLKAQSAVDAQRTVLLTAAGSDEFAGPLPGLGRPAFSYLVLGGLRGWADIDGDSQVTGAELAAYARKVLHAVDRSQTPSAEGAVGAVLSSVQESGPDLKALALKYSEQVETAAPAPKVELRRVPELGGTLKGGVVLGADVEALVAYDAAVKAEKTADGEAKAAAWKALAAVGGNNPYKADAERQAAAWARYVEQAAALDKVAAVEFNKLRQLLPLSVISVEQKKALVAGFQARFGMLASWVGKVAELTGGGGGGEMVAIPGGSFTMGDRKDAVTAASFELDRTAVTVAAYRACVEVGKCPEGKGTGYYEGKERLDWAPYCNWGKSGRDNHPMNCVDWNAAKTYCEAQGKRLPTEEEREWAARGGEEGRTYPWGNAAPAGQLCWNGEGNDLGKGQRKSTCPVSNYPAGHSKHGVHDLAGNVLEWTSSPWESGSPLRVFRGGSWGGVGLGNMRAARRAGLEPLDRSRSVGFRCARSAP